MLSVHLHPAPPLAPTAHDAIVRAAADALAVAGAYARSPVRFVGLGAQPALGAGTWVLVTCERSGEAAHEAHLLERCRTAVQRFTLSLWSDGVEAVWQPDARPPAAALAGVALDGMEPVGLVWCPDDEATAGAA